MNIGVIGSRSFSDYELLKSTLDDLDISMIVSGGAIGADSLAEIYAKEKGIKTLIFKPDWALGKSAAAIRNLKIVEHSDVIVSFWDGLSRGTKMTMRMAYSKNVKVIKIIYKK